jgi:hypothetical protein
MTTRHTPKLHPTVTPELYRRRVRNGWTPGRAADTPLRVKPSPPILIDGVRTTISEAMRAAGVGISLYHSRRRLGWTNARACSTPPGHSGRPDAKTEAFYEHEGKRMSLWAWSKELGFKYRTVLQRVNRGLTFDEAIQHKFYRRLPKS